MSTARLISCEMGADLAEARKGAPDQLPDKSRALLTEMLPLDLDIGIAATHVHAESYWKRRCQSRKGWNNFELRHHGFSWKQVRMTDFIVHV